MNEKEKGVVIPFRLSGSRMRRSAVQYRRQGQVLDALALVRRAAEQDDTAAAWQALAAELRQMSCWEAAQELLARVLSREDCAPSAWLDMARCCSALGQEELAADCLYHLLQEDPWSPEGDAARAMLPEVSAEEDPAEPRRTPMLIQRGLRAWYAGEEALGERRLCRAVRLTRDKERLMVTMALMYMMHWDFPRAGKWLVQALKLNPVSPRALCTLSAVYQQMGKPRIARTFLRMAMPFCMDSRLEEQFLTSAWALDAWKEMGEYLEIRLKRDPYRTTLLNARAAMRYDQGDLNGAIADWRQALSIDPTDRRAGTLLAFAKENRGEELLPPPTKLPRIILERQRTQLQQASGEKLFRFGSEERKLLDWFAASVDGAEQRIALEKAMAQEDKAALRRWLKEILTRPNVSVDACQQALVQLAEMDCTEPMTMLVGSRYTTVQCQKTRQPVQRSMWRLFLPLLLRETRRYGHSREITEFAAEMFRAMSPAQRKAAGTDASYLWVKGIEVLWLRMTGQEDKAVRVVKRMLVSPRRLSRVLRQLGKTLEKEPVTPEEERS